MYPLGCRWRHSSWGQRSGALSQSFQSEVRLTQNKQSLGFRETTHGGSLLHSPDWPPPDLCPLTPFLRAKPLFSLPISSLVPKQGGRSLRPWFPVWVSPRSSPLLDPLPCCPTLVPSSSSGPCPGEQGMKTGSQELFARATWGWASWEATLDLLDLPGPGKEAAGGVINC